MIADWLFLGARLWSPGGLSPGADAVAVAGGRTIAIGPSAALRPLAGPDTRIVHAGGATLTPGLCDAHIHLVAWARSRREIPLGGLRSPAAVAAAVGDWARRNPAAPCLIGRGWSAEAWEVPPHHAILDAVCADRMVVLHSHDFHAVWVNGAALQRAQIHAATPDSPDGIIERDIGGAPTGVLREHAVRRVLNCLPAVPEQADREAVADAVAALHAAGITAVHDFEGEMEARLLRPLGEVDPPQLRILMHLPHCGLESALREGLRSGVGHPGFRWGAVKLFADGTLGSRTAACLDPYDDAEGSGLDLIPPGELQAIVGRACAGGLSVAIHAIGDRAVRHSLDAFAHAPLKGLAMPPRIEHVQLVHAEDLPRFAALGVAASLQPAHCLSDIPIVERAWARRAGRSYPWRSLAATGARLAFGSDAPVEPPLAMVGVRAAVVRERREAGGPFIPAERLTLDEALAAYTEGPARLAGAWPDTGRLATGSTADLVLWDGDLHAMPPGELDRARPRLTLLEGRAVFDDAQVPALRRQGGEEAR